mgnify:CR=1
LEKVSVLMDQSSLERSSVQWVSPLADSGSCGCIDHFSRAVLLIINLFFRTMFKVIKNIN